VDDRRGSGVSSSCPFRSELYESLLRAARTLFSLQGYRASSIRDIAQLAGSSEALVYRHFGSKENLFTQAVLIPFNEGLEDYASEVPLPERGRLELVEAEVDRLFRFVSRHRELFRSLIATSGIQDGPVIAFAEHRSPLHRMFKRFELILRSALPEQTLLTLDPPLTSRACVGLIMSSAVLDDWLFEGAAHTAERIIAELTGLILYGCTARTSLTPSTPRRFGPLPAVVPPDEPGTSAHRRERTTNRQRRSRHEVRRAVLAAARELFSSRGYPGVTTQEIATLAQVSETSVFRHFSSKRNLFERAIFEPFQDWVTTYLASWDRSNRSPASLEQQSRAYVTDTYDLLAGSRGLIRSMIASSALEVEGFPTVADGRSLQGIFLRLEDQLAELAERNGLPGLDIEITIPSTFGMVLALSTLPEWMFDGSESTPSRARLINEMAALMTFGITAR
jgi:AcrR family transcriptional regulator